MAQVVKIGAARETVSAKPKRGDNKTAWIGGGIALAVLVLVAVAVLALRGGGSNSELEKLAQQKATAGAAAPAGGAAQPSVMQPGMEMEVDPEGAGALSTDPGMAGGYQPSQPILNDNPDALPTDPKN